MNLLKITVIMLQKYASINSERYLTVTLHVTFSELVAELQIKVVVNTYQGRNSLISFNRTVRKWMIAS